MSPALQRIVTAGLLALTLGGCRREAGDSDREAPLTVARALGGDADGFARALAPPTLEFPRDHGAHPAFRTEWWYVTANVDSTSGQRFGIELVFFRQALTANPKVRTASLAAHELVFAHAAVTDVAGRRFLHAERIARNDGDLAAIVTQPTSAAPFAIRCLDWSATANASTGHTDATPQPGLLPLDLDAGDCEFAFALRITAGEPMVLQGERGLSRKSAAPGNASIYYSLPRLPIAGTVTVAGEAHQVQGLAWIDREWSTSALAADQVGWDWFSLQLDDDSELMWYGLRRNDGSLDPCSRGVLVLPDGRVVPLDADAVTATPDGRWTAPDGRASYPRRWRLSCREPALALDVTPVLPDQELVTLVRYWEGAVDVVGTRASRAVSGRGYLEMTGYAR